MNPGPLGAMQVRYRLCSAAPLQASIVWGQVAPYLTIMRQSPGHWLTELLTKINGTYAMGRKIRGQYHEAKS